MKALESAAPAICEGCQTELNQADALSGKLCWRCRLENERLLQAKEFYRADIVEAMRQAGVGKRHANLKLNSFRRAPQISAVCRRFLDGKVTGLFLHGVPGCGKTSLAAGLVRECLWEGVPARMVVVPQLLQALRVATWNTRVNEQELLERYSRAPVLVLDDLGAEDKTDRTMDRLYLIVNERYQECRQTVITSNLKIPEISKQLHARLASRIGEMCETIKFPAKDYRVEG